MKVRSRLALATALALLALLLTFYLGGRAILVNTFYLVEREVLRGIPTLEKAVQGELLQLDALATNVPEAEVLAALRHGQTDVLAAHFPVSRMLRDNLNLVALVDTNGGMAAAVYRPLGGRSAGALPASFRAHVAPGTNLLDYASSPTGVRKGVVLIDEGPLLVVSQRLPADPGLPMAGAVVCGRHLQEEAVIQRLAAALPGLRVAAGIRRDLTLRPADGAAAGSSGDIVGTHVEIAPWQSGLAGYEALLPVKDIYNRHVFSLVLSLPRTFGALAETALAWLSLFVALVGMLFIAPLLVLQGRAVLNPLTRLSEEIRALGPGDRTLRRLRWTRRDEFGVVAEAVNGMPPPPPLPPSPGNGNGSAAGRRVLRALLALAAIGGSIAGCAYYLKRQGVHLRELPGGAAAQQAYDWLRSKAGRAPGAPGVGAPAATRAATQYSPAVPVREARRVAAAVSNRVERDAADTAAAAPAVTAAAKTNAVPAARTVAAASRPPAVWPPMHVSAVATMAGRRSFARINGRLLSAGDTIDGVTVVHVSASGVTLAFGGERREVVPER